MPLRGPVRAESIFSGDKRHKARERAGLYRLTVDKGLELITRSHNQVKDAPEGYIRDSLSLPLRICPKTKDVCEFYHDGLCYENGERKSIARVHDCK